MSTEKQNTVSDSETESKEKLWDTGDVATYLGVKGRETVRRYVEKHGLPFIRLPRGVRYDPEAVRQWAKSREQVKDAPAEAA
jgi:excisionase family DNA binding protein